MACAGDLHGGLSVRIAPLQQRTALTDAATVVQQQLHA
eukprot:ctg_3180.g489